MPYLRKIFAQPSKYLLNKIPRRQPDRLHTSLKIHVPSLFRLSCLLSLSLTCSRSLKSFYRSFWRISLLSFRPPMNITGICL
jgi:hypothetical protein